MDAVTSILIVDDIEQNLVAMEALLARPEIRILKASSGAQALEILLTEEVALALLDVQMPEMDGFELAELLRGRESTRSIPLIFLTAAARDPARTFRGYDAGAVDFLHKPVDPHILRSKVDVFVDLHVHRKRLAVKLSELEEALRLNEILTAVLGHDLRSPLAAISMSSELLKRQASEPAALAAAERIRRSSDRMARMISQLLDFSRIRAHGLQLQPHSIDLAQLANAAREELEAAGVTRLHIEQRGDTIAWLDSDRMAQVLGNLIGNALEHGSATSPVDVLVDGTAGDRLRLVVSNEGSIPADRLERIFLPFQSERSESNATAGLGLGLHIVEQFVKAHGGKVRVVTDVPDRTSFEISLPRRAEM